MSAYENPRTCGRWWCRHMLSLAFAMVSIGPGCSGDRHIVEERTPEAGQPNNGPANEQIRFHPTLIADAEGPGFESGTYVYTALDGVVAAYSVSTYRSRDAAARAYRADARRAELLEWTVRCVGLTCERVVLRLRNQSHMILWSDDKAVMRVESQSIQHARALERQLLTGAPKPVPWSAAPEAHQQ